MLEDRVKWFGVWGLLPWGGCACPRGQRRNLTDRDQWVSTEGDCKRPGKHPLTVKMPDGSLYGFPHGFHDAVERDVWLREHAANVAALGGREAVAVPDWAWVLDADSREAWKSLVKLFKGGAFTFDDVLRASKTPRGWHVWVDMKSAGWWQGGAQKRLNEVLAEVGDSGGLEAKSGGGYVLWTNGLDRREVAVPDFAREVAQWSTTHYGWGSQWRREGKGDLPYLPGETAPEKVESVEFTEQVREAVGALWDSWTPEQQQDYIEGQVPMLRANYEASLARVVGTGEGGRNNSLNRAVYIEGRPLVEAGADPDEVVSLAVGAGTRAGLTAAECYATARSALKGLI